MREATGIFYVDNGKVVSVDDWKNQAGSNVIYEVIRIIEGKILFYEAHYDRMINSLKLSKIESKIKKEYLKECINSLIKANGIKEGNIKITFDMNEEVLRIFFIKHSYPTEDMYSLGVKTILYFGERTNPNIKIINNNFRQDVQVKLKEAKSFEAILVNCENNITEGSKSNIFFIQNNVLFTSRVEQVLPGVTRTEIIKVAKKHNVSVVEKNINKNMLEEFDSAFITGTSPNILPINQIDEYKYNVNNELLRQIMTLFKRKIEGEIQFNS